MKKAIACMKRHPGWMYAGTAATLLLLLSK